MQWKREGGVSEDDGHPRVDNKQVSELAWYIISTVAIIHECEIITDYNFCSKTRDFVVGAFIFEKIKFEFKTVEFL